MNKLLIEKLKRKRIAKMLFGESDKCSDCRDRPKFELKDLIFNNSESKLCNRHFYLFSKKFEKWFLEDKITV